MKISRTWFLGHLLVACGLLAGCGIVEKTLNTKHRLFVRMPVGIRTHDPALETVGRVWAFKHVVEAPATQDGKVPQNWYYAWRRDGKEPKLGKWFHRWDEVEKLTVEVARDAHAVFGVYPVLVEPSSAYHQKPVAVVPVPQPFQGGRTPGTVELGDLPGKSWSYGRTDDGRVNPLWHLDDQHSQLASAQAQVGPLMRSAGDKRVRIGILDSGFDSSHPSWPKHITNDPQGNAMSAIFIPDSLEGKVAAKAPGSTLGSHGTGALSILASPAMKLHNTKPGKVAHADNALFEFGAAPDAHIVAVAVSPTMVSLSTANLAYGIDYASRREKCDVISMSHGGSPSQMWTDAVNSAYNRGTAMYAATGDYFPFPWVPLRTHRLGLIVPSSSVFPAAFRRVVGVAGVNENHNAYGLTDWLRYVPRMLYSGFMRGSYGADGVRRTFVDSWRFREEAKTDSAQIRRHNLLHANPISAYTPGVPWAVVSKGKVNEKKVLDLDGGGTSSAVPQAAAAAALWLQQNRPRIESLGEWDSWKKAQASYIAMLYHAGRPWSPDGSDKAGQKPDVFLGAGELKANDMLRMSYDEAKKVRGRTLAFPFTGRDTQGIVFRSGETGMARDFFDGQRSFYRALAGPSHNEVRADFRLLLQEECYSDSQEWPQALDQMMFNRRLIELWQLGQTPFEDRYLKTPPSKGGMSLLGRVRYLFGMSGVSEKGINRWKARKARELSDAESKPQPPTAR